MSRVSVGKVQVVGRGPLSVSGMILKIRTTGVRAKLCRKIFVLVTGLGPEYLALEVTRVHGLLRR